MRENTTTERQDEMEKLISTLKKMDPDTLHAFRLELEEKVASGEWPDNL